MTQKRKGDILTVGLAQIAPVWMNRKKSMAKVLSFVQEAAELGCQLVAFGEGLVPGYPFWIERSNGAVFNSPVQKEMHALYLANAVQIEAGHLDELCVLAGQLQITVILGCIERPADRGGHSVYATLVTIDREGTIQPTHRKLMPTYEERLSWSPGDGHGLRTHSLGSFTLGALNCWENWMPLARAALYGLGEDLHVALWPGSDGNTRDITRFMALEGRSYVLSVSGLMRHSDIPADSLMTTAMAADVSEIYANGGSCLAGPDGEWLIAPVIDEERLLTAEISHKRVREERHNYDPAGHYARPDVLRLTVNRQRQSTIELID